MNFICGACSEHDFIAFEGSEAFAAFKEHCSAHYRKEPGRSTEFPRTIMDKVWLADRLRLQQESRDFWKKYDDTETR